MIWAWIVTSSALVGSSAMADERLRTPGPSRSGRAGPCRRRARADRPRARAGRRGCRPCRRWARTVSSLRLWPRSRARRRIWSPTALSGFRAPAGFCTITAILRPQHLPQLRFGQAQQVGALEAHRPRGHHRPARQVAQDRAQRRRLAGARRRRRCPASRRSRGRDRRAARPGVRAAVPNATDRSRTSSRRAPVTVTGPCGCARAPRPSSAGRAR